MSEKAPLNSVEITRKGNKTGITVCMQMSIPSRAARNTVLLSIINTAIIHSSVMIQNFLRNEITSKDSMLVPEKTSPAYHILFMR